MAQLLSVTPVEFNVAQIGALKFYKGRFITRDNLVAFYEGQNSVKICCGSVRSTSSYSR